MRFVRPFIAGCIGGAVGAIFASVTGMGASGTGVTGIFGILLFLNKPLMYVLLFIISFAAAFGISWVITPSSLIDAKLGGQKEMTPAQEKEESGKDGNKEEVKGDIVITSPLEGEIVSVEETGDPTFIAGVLGKTIAIMPTKGMVYAPDNGTIVALMGHAVGIKLDKGPELIIHVGVNTVELNGKHYTAKINTGDRVKKGDELLGFDIAAIKEAGYPVVTPVIITNSFDYSDIEVSKNKTVKENVEIMRIKNT